MSSMDIQSFFWRLFVEARETQDDIISNEGFPDTRRSQNRFECSEEDSLQEMFNNIRNNNHVNGVRDFACSGESMKELSGSFPSDVPFMPALTNFHVTHHPELTGTLPDSFFELQNLETW